MEKHLFELLTADKSFRYERKFIVDEMPVVRIEYVVNFHPGMFKEIFQERQVNNVYFDTGGFHNYFENVEGVSRRLKMRVRWYGETFGEVPNPVLELKIKNGLLGTKLSYPLKPFRIQDSYRMPDFRSAFDQSGLPPLILELTKDMGPTVINCYRRRYYQSDDRHFRITIDKDLKYYKVGTHRYMSSARINEQRVLELKYDPQYDDQANQISTLFPFRLSKSSKYVNGFERLYL